MWQRRRGCGLCSDPGQEPACSMGLLPVKGERALFRASSRRAPKEGARAAGLLPASSLAPAHPTPAPLRRRFAHHVRLHRAPRRLLHRRRGEAGKASPGRPSPRPPPRGRPLRRRRTKGRPRVARALACDTAFPGCLGFPRRSGPFLPPAPPERRASSPFPVSEASLGGSRGKRLARPKVRL